MIQRVSEHYKFLFADKEKNRIFRRQMLWTVLFWMIMMIVLFFNIRFMNNHFPDPPRPPDLILDAVGPNDKFIAAGEIFSIIQISVMLSFFLSTPERLRRLPHLLSLVAFVYCLRSFVILLTPLGQIQPPSENYADAHLLAKYFYHGMFFSGHTANVITQVLFVRNEFIEWAGRKIRFSWIVLPLSIGQITSLLISHQHYSIDIFGAIFVAYFAATFDFKQIIPSMLKENRYMPWYVPEPVMDEADSLRGNGFRPDGRIGAEPEEEPISQPVNKGQQEQP